MCHVMFYIFGFVIDSYLLFRFSYSTRRGLRRTVNTCTDTPIDTIETVVLVCTVRSRPGEAVCVDWRVQALCVVQEM